MRTDGPTEPTGSGPVLAAAAALTCAAAAVGAWTTWPAPDRVMSGWQVADVPASTAALVSTALLGVVPLAVAVAITRPRR